MGKSTSNIAVFLSSTAKDLQHFREAAYQAINRLDGFSCVRMEDFGARNWAADDFCRSEVHKCDLFVGIVGHLHGSCPSGCQESFTEREYDAAVSRDIPRLMFLAPDEFPVHADHIESEESRKKQVAFRQRVRQERTVSQYPFNSPDQLACGIIEAIRNWERGRQPTVKPAFEKPDTPSVCWGAGSQPLPPEVVERIERYRSFVQGRQFSTAFHEFFEWPQPEASLNYLLDFVYNRCAEHLALVLQLFPKGIHRDPPELNRSQRAKALNSLARGYKNTGQLIKAIDTFDRQLRTEAPTGTTGVWTLANYVNALRLAGRLRRATECAQRLLQLAQIGLPNQQSTGYSLYWNGIVEAALGHYDDAEMLLRQAEIVFEPIAVGDNYRGLGRTHAHLAQLELWLGHARLAKELAYHSYTLAEMHRESREFILTKRLMGMAALMSGGYDESHQLLSDARRDAGRFGYFEEQLAADIGLAEMDHRVGNLKIAEQELSEVEVRAEDGGYTLLRVDALIGLARVLRKDGQCSEAIRTALAAYECACCDSPPYCYSRGLRAASQILAQLGAARPPAQERDTTDLLQGQHKPQPCDEGRLKKARLRCELSKHMRIMTGPYRYTPTKFIRLLREDWDAICRIVRSQDATWTPLPPQYVEIHVGEPCHLSCLYCRGGLRQVTGTRVLTRVQLERIVTEIHSLNSKAFIRFSGLIGDPLRPSYIAAVFECVSQAGLEWGVTTNGLGDRSRNIPEELYQSLMNANYVHVSLDAGTDETYRRLKRGRTGDFDTVLKHVTEILQRRELRRKDFHRRQDRDVEPAVVVSVLLQPENFRELLAISQRVKDMGVDSVEIKMQHFHADRRMSEREVKEAYRVIDEVRQLDDGRFCVVVVQSEDQAIGKVRGNDVSITFSRCYANELGLNATVDPAGNLQTCCQYYQGTLGPQGCATKLGFGQVWSSDERRATLRRDPREILSDRQDQYQRRCTNCSPSDEFVNRFIDFLRRANEEDPEFLTWAGKQIDSVLGAWKASTGTR